MIQLQIRKNAYYDSVTLMIVSKELKKLPGVQEALVGMGTELNLEIARNIGVSSPELETGATANDFFIALLCESEAAFSGAIEKADELLNKKTDAKAAAYVECAIGERVLWGVGLHSSIVRASFMAILSAINRAERDASAAESPVGPAVGVTSAAR